jgi:MraZ protein
MKLQGRHSIKMDGKGRLALPVDLQTRGSMYVTSTVADGVPYLDLVPEKAWREIERKMARMPKMDRHVQAFRRFYVASAQTLECDEQNRIVLPLELRSYAKLGTDIVLLGVGEKIEIWSAENWVQFQQDTVARFDEVLAAITGYEDRRR